MSIGREGEISRNNESELGETGNVQRKENNESYTSSSEVRRDTLRYIK